MLQHKYLLLICSGVLLGILRSGQLWGQAEPSMAKRWNEVLLTGIRNDFARPTIHARNLFHVSVAMYDAWACMEPTADTYFLGKSVGGFSIPFQGFAPQGMAKETAQEIALSYATYRLMEHRFRNSPRFAETKATMDALMQALGHDPFFFGTEYTSGNPAALGNYLAEQIRLYGLQDGSNELSDYQNLFYEPCNPPLPLVTKGSNPLPCPNGWQPLEFDQAFIDQGGNVVNPGIIGFLSPEWGHVKPFALEPSDRTVRQRNGHDFPIYLDPGPPPYLDSLNGICLDDPYKWGFLLVSVWGSHLQAEPDELIEISPRSIGNVPDSLWPLSYEAMPGFYDFTEGGDMATGHPLNPKTGQPYAEQWVPKGDYTRVLAEFWADGPDSETPPGHWYTLLNYVSYHPEFSRKFKGEGPELSPLEWDIKAYFLLGGAMHDAAIAAWSVKGYYDYIRPISALRFMGTMGQSSDPDLPSYSPMGLPLVPGFSELVLEGDSLAGENGAHLHKMKLYTWKGHDYIADAATDKAGAGWVLAQDWWPYQRPSFVTPPFAGYVSGHSTFSRAAAELMALLTGDPYFPGGMGEFVAEANNYLVFEKGPSQTVRLQWATYFDASDQCSLSRIWGGIHPPADDIPGRLMGKVAGRKAFAHGEKYFDTRPLSVSNHQTLQALTAYPNPSKGTFQLIGLNPNTHFTLFNAAGQSFHPQMFTAEWGSGGLQLDLAGLPSGLYIFRSAAGQALKLLKQ